MELVTARKGILRTLGEFRAAHDISFTESTHKYTMRDANGTLRDDWRTVTGIVKDYYTPFDADAASSRLAKGDIEAKGRLLRTWELAGEVATNKGSRTHYFLEKKCCDMFDLGKELRKPQFNCDETSESLSDNMVSAGIEFLELMKERGALALDTEVIMGSPECGFLGQGDNLWLIKNKKNDGYGLLITDYKTNKPEKFEPTKYTIPMKFPFYFLDDTELGKYSIQLSLYARLLRSMLKGSEFEDIKVLGCIIILLKDDGTFKEYKVDRKVMECLTDFTIR